MKRDRQVEKVHAEHSFALAEAQLLEQYFGHFVVAFDVSTDLGSAENARCLLMRQGLGRLIQSLEERLRIPGRLKTRLDAARGKRNWLAHQYFFDRSGWMQTCAGRSEMIRELDGLGEEFYRLWGYFDDAIVAWLQGGDHTNGALVAQFARSVRA